MLEIGHIRGVLGLQPVPFFLSCWLPLSECQDEIFKRECTGG